MALRLESINDNVRGFMLQEIEYDVQKGTLYLSKHFNETGNASYLDLIRQTVQRYDDEWLAERIRRGKCMKRTYIAINTYCVWWVNGADRKWSVGYAVGSWIVALAFLGSFELGRRYLGPAKLE